MNYLRTVPLRLGRYLTVAKLLDWGTGSTKLYKIQRQQLKVLGYIWF